MFVPLALLLATGCTIRLELPVELMQPPTPVEGRDLYVAACASCHGLSGTGDGPAAAALRAAPTDLTRLQQLHQGIFPRDQVVATITGERQITAHGSREMPVWNQRFSTNGSGASAVAAIYVGRQVAAITSYVESLQR